MYHQLCLYQFYLTIWGFFGRDIQLLPPVQGRSVGGGGRNTSPFYAPLPSFFLSLNFGDEFNGMIFEDKIKILNDLFSHEIIVLRGGGRNSSRGSLTNFPPLVNLTNAPAHVYAPVPWFFAVESWWVESKLFHYGGSNNISEVS